MSVKSDSSHKDKKEDKKESGQQVRRIVKEGINLNEKDIAIIGMACRFPDAKDYRQFGYNLMQGINSIKEIPSSRWDINKYYSPNFDEPNKSISKWCGLIEDIDQFDNKFFNISPREANNMDPQQRLLLEETWHCIEDSGVALSRLQQKMTSVFVGVMAIDYHQDASAPDVITDSYACLGNYECILANRISYVFGLQGASISIDAACASSLVAIHEAKRTLIMKESDYALASGVSLNFHPWKYISFSKSRMLSPDGQCKTFDIKANGYVPGEGVGVLLLQRLEDAIKDGNHIYGIIKGSAVNHGGKTLSITAPRVEAQKNVILSAYKDAEVSPDTVTYVEAHGTGTSLGDPIEIESITQAFRKYTEKEQFCKIGSVKSNIGHLEAAAGVAGVIKVLMMMKHRKIPKSLNITQLNPIINFGNSPFTVATELNEWQERGPGLPLRAGVSSFGFGGVNSHLVLEEYSEYPVTQDNGSELNQLFILSGKSPDSMKHLIEDWKRFVQSETYSHLSLKDICVTLKLGRGNFPYRYGVHTRSKEELKKSIKTAVPTIPKQTEKNWCFRIGDFSFDSLSQFQGYLNRFDLFTQHLEDVKKSFLNMKDTKGSLNDFDDESWAESNRALYSFMLVYAGACTLMDLGFRPDVITGEKAGVMVGLVISGIMSLEDALAVLNKQKNLNEIQFTRPRIPYYDSVLKKTVMPFHFTPEYLRLLVDELGRHNKRLGQLLVDGILYTEENGSQPVKNHRKQTLLGNLLLQNLAITQKQLEEALSEQKKTKDFLGNILVKKGYCTSDALSACLVQQTILRNYVHEVFRHYVDQARLLNISQFTFKKYLEEWDVILKKSGKSIQQFLFNEKLILQEGRRTRHEKLLFMLIIMNCLRRLNQKWNLTEQKLVEEKRFYELLDLVTDTVMPKEDLVELFLSDNPDYMRIARTLNKRQVHRNLNNSYRYIKKLNPNIQDIEEVSRWLDEAIETKNVLPADSMAYLPVDSIAFFEFGIFHEQVPFKDAVHLKIGKNLCELFTDSLLQLWLNGVDIQWEKIYQEGSYKKVVLPLYPFDRKSFWLPRNIDSQISEGIDDSSEMRHTPWELKQSDQKGNLFRRTFTIQDPIINDHVITGQPIIPGASMIEFGLAAIQAALNQKIGTLENIIIQNPSIVENEISVEAEINLQEKKFIIKTDTHILCKGAYQDAESTPLPSIDLSSYRNKPPQAIKNLYPSLSQIGYQYGNGLQVIQNIWESDQAFIVELNRLSPEEGEMTSLNPRILDGIFQSALAIEYLEGRLPEDNTLYVPYYIKSLNILEETRDHCFVYIHKQDLKKRGPDINVQISVYDESGKAVLWIQDMLFKRVSDQFLKSNSQILPKAKDDSKASAQIYLYQSEWIPKSLPYPDLDASQRTAILLIDDNELSTQLSREIALKYHKIFTISPQNAFSLGDHSHFEINPEIEQDYMAILQDILSQTGDGSEAYDIYFLWAYDHQACPISDLQDLSDKQRKGVQSLFFLAKALAMAHIKEKARIVICTNKMHVIEPQDKGEGYGFGGLLGLAKTIMLENPKIRIKMVDLDTDDMTPSEASSILIDEVLSSESADIVAYRKRDRYIRIFEPFHFMKSQPTSILRDQRVYLLIGGAGGIGIKVAEIITKQVNARLVLIDRSELSTEKQQQFQQIQSTGSEILYLQGDVTNPEEMKKLIETIKARYGSINGVIHLVGILRDRLLVSKDWESFQRVMAPKVQGTWIMNQLTQKEPLDFFLVFSSIVSILGNIGQADYAAANSFLDTFISYRSQNNHPGTSVSVNWTLWADGGMGDNEQIRKGFESRGLCPIPSNLGLQALEQIINRGKSSQFVVLGGKLKEFDLIDKEKIVQKQMKPKKQGKISEESTLMQIEDYLATLVASKLGSIAREIKRDESFFSLGVESIIVQEIMSELDKKFENLTPTLLFEYPNICELAEFLKDKTPKDGGHIDGLNDQTINEEDGIEEEILIPENEETYVQSYDDSPQDDSKDHSPSLLTNMVEPRIPSFQKRGYEIAIIGMSGRFPKAPNIDIYWKNLIAGRDCIEEIPRERWDHNQYFDSDPNNPNKAYGKWGGFIKDVDKFDPLFFNISPKEAEQMDPQQRLFLESTWETMEHAGYGDRGRYKDKIVGLFVGVMWNEYSILANQEGFLKDMYPGPGSLYWIIANRVSYVMDFKGPSIALDTACSSSLLAVHLACQSIINGDADMAVAGGINISIHPSKYLYLSQARFLSTDGRCRSFGEGGNGYVPGEGVGSVLLKPLEQAIRDGDHIYGIIRGSSSNHGGKATGLTVPNPEAQARLIVKAFERAQISAEQIGYIECHGTGTALGDPIEINGLTRVFKNFTDKKQFCPIGSVKSNVGHLEAAAGVAALIKVLLCMHHNKIPKSLHSETKNPNINFKDTPFYVVNEAIDWISGPSKPKLAAISSFGAGGTNAHIVLEAFERKDTRARYQPGIQSQAPQIIVLSAKNEERLTEYAGRMVEFLEKAESASFFLTDMAYTLQVGREAMEERLAVVVSDITELKERLSQYLENNEDIKDLYTGNIKKNKTIGDLLVGETDGEELIRLFIKNRNISKIAQLWASGVKIDWSLLYPDHTPNRISLPTYPFARQTYWIPESHQPINVSNNSHTVKLHPLIDQNTSTLHEERFSTMLTGDEFYLKDHIVGGQKVLPGVAYIEMARAASEIAGERKVQKIKNTVWLQPIASADGSQKVHISLYPKQDTVEYKISTNADAHQKVIHAQGKVIFAPETNSQSQAEAVDIEAIKKRCSDMKESVECYRLFQKRGLKYGPSFQPIQKLWSNATEALSLLRLPSLSINGFKDFVLHPSMMDGALQTVIGLMNHSGTDNESLYIPFALGEVELIGPLPERCYAHCVFRGNKTVSADKKFNIRLMDEEGSILLKMQDVSLRAIQPQISSASSIKEQKNPEITYFKNVWEESPLRVKTHEHKPLGHILLFDLNEDIRNSLREKLKGEHDSHIILVKPGECFQELENSVFKINPGQLEDYRRLMEILKSQNHLPGQIIYSWSQDEFLPDQKALHVQLEQGIYSVLYLSQALMEQKTSNKIRMIFAYPGNNEESQPLYAAISGFARTIHRETPRFIYRTVEIGKTMHALDVLWREIRNEADDEIEIHYEEEQRWVKRLKEFDPANEAEDDGIKGLLKERGVYMITGGMGGLGLIFAEYLVRHKGAKLVLTGRSELSAGKEAQIKRLESLGSEVTYIKADVSKREDTVKLIAEIKSRFQKINGIIHSAGVIRDTFVLKKTREEMDAVLAPKVYGTVYLDEATKDDDLDFFVMFSSITAVMGNAGQCDYAYGNSFMDQFAKRREALREKGERAGKTLSINWPLWKEGGMQVDEQTERLLEKTIGMQPLDTEAGLNAFVRGLNLKESQFVVVEGERQKLRKTLIGGNDHYQQGSTETKDELNQSMEDKTLPKIQKDVSEIVSDILKVGIKDIHLDEEMSDYGFDSVSFTVFSNRINETFNLDITPAIFFEHPSIGSFTQYLYEEYKESFMSHYQESMKPDISDIQEEPNEATIEEVKPQSRFQSSTEKEEPRDGEMRFANEPIAIIGISGVMPQSGDLETFWSHLEEGKDLISEIPKDRWNWRSYYGDQNNEANKTKVKWGGFMKEVDRFDALFFGISPREAELMDPQQRIFLETVWKTIEDAGYKPSDLSGTNTGIFVGAATTDYQELIRDRSIDIQAQTSTGRFHSITANRISYLLNLHGPSEPIDTACSSSLIAIHRATQAIRMGNCDMAIAGGINVMLTPTLHISFSKAGMLCEDGRCKTFDKRANGYVRGEGAGAILLKPLSKAEADGDHIYAVIKGTAENHGGHANSLTAPNPNAQAQVLISAYEEAGIDPDTVSYIEAHGTGTSLGDPIEINGLKKAFEELYQRSGKPLPKEPHCGIGTVKTNIGHLETAAGIAGILKVLLSMKYKKMPANIHFEEINPFIQLQGTPFYIVSEARQWEHLLDKDNQPIPRRAGVSSFGFGGANAHIVLEDYERPISRSGSSSQGSQVIVLSAKNEERLNAYAGKLKGVLAKLKKEVDDGLTHINLSDIAYTLQTGREAMEERLAVIVSDIEELITKLARYCQGETEIEDLFRGNVQAGKIEAGLLLKGRAGKEFIRIIIDDKEFEKLAQLWVSGVDIDWRLLYANHAPHRISLPTYPFARERYWIPETPKVQKGITNGLNPLIDRVVPELSLTQGLVFQKTLKDTDLIVGDHKVQGQCILPGVGYLEMAYEAISEIMDSRHFHLEQVVWLRPLPVGAEKKAIHILIKQENEKLQYEIQSGNHNEPVIHSKGAIHFNTEATDQIDQYVSVEEIRGRCTRHIEKEGLYKRFKEHGITYGPYFQGLSKIWSNDEEALGLLNLPSEYESELNQYTLHPTLMDGALQTIAGLKETQKQTLLPFAVEKVEILHPLKSRGYAYVKALGHNQFHVAILDDAGLVCIKLHDVALRASEDPLQNLFYSPKWMPVPLSSIHSENMEVIGEKEKGGRTILIISPSLDSGLGKALREAHPKDEVMEIRLGKETKEYAKNYREIVTGDPSALDSCIKQLTNIHMIYFLGGILEQGVDADDLDAAQEKQEQGVISLFRLIKSLSKHHLIQSPMQLKVITNDVHRIESEQITNPHAASLSGLTKVITSEYPMIEAACIDISLNDLEADPSEWEINDPAGSILSEPVGKRVEEVAIRDGKRYVRTLMPIVLPPVNILPFRHHGVYLILGGAGGIGMELSRYLSEAVKARLILLGRSELDARRKEKISQIESKGGKVLYLTADATDPESIRAAIRKAKSQFGQINGVIHSAIVLRDMILENMDEESFRTALAPKIRGSICLYKAVEEESLDFMMFFSSAVSFFGNRGQSNYTAGCTFKDAFAHYINQRTPYPAKIINWGFWGSVGVAATEEYKRRLRALGAQSIEPEEGMQAIQRILNHPVDQIMAIKAEDHLLEEMGVDLEHQMRIEKDTGELRLRERKQIPEERDAVKRPEPDAARKGPSDAPQDLEVKPSTETGHQSPNLRKHHTPQQKANKEEDIKEYIKEGIVENIAASIGMSNKEIDHRKTFSVYGVDSIIGLELINKLNKAFGIALKTGTIFNYANVTDLSNYIYAQYGEKIAETAQKGERKGKGITGSRTISPKANIASANDIFQQKEKRKGTESETDTHIEPAIKMVSKGNSLQTNRLKKDEKEKGPRESLSHPKPITLKEDHFRFQRILLTGSTGILGGYILKELLETTNAKIHCLVRANDINHAKERLKKVLASYGAEDSLLSVSDHRIFPVIGDITKENLGLSEREYQHLADSIDCTIHIAASTNLIMPYDYLAPINVQGVKHIIDLALQTKQKYMIYVSSYHVMADVIYRSHFAFTEQDLDVGQGFPKMGYQETKFEGERLVREASREGLIWNIFRPGNIFGEQKTGSYPLEMSGSASIFHRLFELIIKSGVAAFGQNYFDITPVDYIAKSLLFLGLKRNAFYETYHLLNTDKKHWYEIINLVNDYGYKIRLLPVDDYLKMVHEDSLPLDEGIAPEWLNLMKYGFAHKEFFINDGHADAGYTQSILEKEGIICPKIDLKLLGTYLTFYASKGIIPLPVEENSHKNKPIPQIDGTIGKNSTGSMTLPRLKEKAMKDKKYDFIVVGSGAGGATVAKELAKKGKRVLIVEKGKRYKKIGGLLNSFQYFDHHKVTLWPKASKEGVFLYRAIMAGGSTAVSCGNGTRCSEDELAALGINLNGEFSQAEEEMGIAPFNLKWLSRGSRKIFEASKELGYRMEPMPKFLRHKNCRQCATCYMGCKYNAKWTSLDYLDEAIKDGADVMYETTIERVLHKNGKATGVKGKGPQGKVEVLADTVILSAGGLATPVILQKTGIEDAGANLFGDLLVNTYGVTKNLSQLNEPSMALVDNEFHESKGFILSTWPQPSRIYRFAEAGVRGMRLPPDRTLGIMTKSADDPNGRVYPDGSFSKSVTDNDRARLDDGAEIAKEILIKAGADSKSIIVGKPFGAHPGGTAAIGKIVDKDLQTEIENLFVCDASVFPTSLGAPPILTIAALAKRLAKTIVAENSYSIDKCQIKHPFLDKKQQLERNLDKIA
ncbi:MAG: thioester reductase domain-containing protein [bacterium]